MRNNLKSQLIQTGILNETLLQIDWLDYATSVSTIHHYLEEIKGELTGWQNYPLEDNGELIQSVQRIADEIKTNADVLVVIGVGGSYLGARAIQEALTPYFGLQENGIPVIYVGQNLSGTYIQQLLKSLEHQEVYVNVISKSGTTMEPALAFRVLRNYMENRYGEEAQKRIIITTDATKGLLKKIAVNSGYRQFPIPSNIGGRYSIFTAVGLLPIAVAGIDIQQLLEGAKKAAVLLKEERLDRNESYRYAVIRHALYQKGYHIELLASFEPALAQLHEWWKQLFGESEGKERKGLFPATVTYSTDLHSIGQFVQEGNPILFETLLHFKEMTDDYRVPFDHQNEDQLNNLSSYSFNEINTICKQGTAMAHADGGVPIIQLELNRLDAYHLGYLLYFFMKACAMSAYLLQVNPFDQPGVEAYKHTMLKLLKESPLYE